MKNINLSAASWADYELIDSGENRKLERYGSFLIVRPETQALWMPIQPAEWKKAVAEFAWVDGKGMWRKKNIPETWSLKWKDACFTVRTNSFKHTGVFPEQASNWEWIDERVRALQSPKVLNLFGYTGIASIVAAKAGARVTHVDASKQANDWAKANAVLSGLGAGEIHYLLEDVLKFVEREARRGNKYEGVILDPPAFGRGPKGEIWKIEESLPRLLRGLASILLKTKNSFFLLNGYAAGYTAQSFLQVTESFFSDRGMSKREGEFGELRIAESHSDRCISAGIYVRFIQR